MALALSLGACGGGGGSDSPAGAGGARITEQNATPIVANAYRASSALYGSGNDAADTSFDLKDASRPHKAAMVDLALQRLEDLAGGSGGGSSRYAKAVSSDSLGCDGGGTITVTVDDADNSGHASTGDSVYFVFANCRNGGVTISGGMSLTALVMTGGFNDPARSLGATFAFDSLSVSNGTVVDRVDGGFSIQASLQTYPVRVVESTVAGASFRVDSAAARGELRNFALDARSDATAGVYGYGISGTVIDSNLGSVVAISNPQRFAGVIGAFPSTGSLLARESGGSAARLTATSSTSVRIDVDSDGDGVFESSMTKTWSEIAGS